MLLPSQEALRQKAKAETARLMEELEKRRSLMRKS